MKSISVIIPLFIFFLPALAQKAGKKDNIQPLHLAPQCEFSVLNYCYGDTVYFINHTISLMNPEWLIMDSAGSMIYYSTDTNIKFFFPAPGTYSVMLKADNGHPDSLTKTLTIGSALKADFLFQQCSQQFVNMSACAGSVYWDFGDNSFSSLPAPAHFYADTGSYTVMLIAFNGTAADTLFQTIQVKSKGFPTGDFWYYQSADTVYFFGDTLADFFNWDFGDGNTSNLQNPWHVYDSAGTYYVNLLVNNYCDIAFQFKEVEVLPFSSVNDLTPTQFSVFPNPALGSLFIKTNVVKYYEVKIFSPAGGNPVKRILFPANTAEASIDVSGLANGLYFVLFRADEKQEIRKIAVMR